MKICIVPSLESGADRGENLSRRGDRPGRLAGNACPAEKRELQLSGNIIFFRIETELDHVASWLACHSFWLRQVFGNLSPVCDGRGFPACFWPGGVPPPRVSPFSMAKRSNAGIDAIFQQIAVISRDVSFLLCLIQDGSDKNIF